MSACSDYNIVKTMCLPVRCSGQSSVYGYITTPGDLSGNNTTGIVPWRDTYILEFQPVFLLPWVAIGYRRTEVYRCG
jgi:hypothetical protein